MFPKMVDGVPSHGLEGLIPAGFLDISKNGGFSPQSSSHFNEGFFPILKKNILEYYTPYFLGKHPYILPYRFTPLRCKFVLNLELPPQPPKKNGVLSTFPTNY